MAAQVDHLDHPGRGRTSGRPTSLQGEAVAWANRGHVAAVLSVTAATSKIGDPRHSSGKVAGNTHGYESQEGLSPRPWIVDRRQVALDNMVADRVQVVLDYIVADLAHAENILVRFAKVAVVCGCRCVMMS